MIGDGPNARRPRRPLAALAFGLVGLTMVLAACGSAGGGGTTSGSTQGSGSTVEVKVASSSQYGKILVDGKGMTLYTYSADKNGKSACTTGTCLALWPPLYAAPGTNGAKAGAGVTASKLGVITRADNHKKQITYGGKPLYYYSPDKAPGQTIGEKVKDSLGTWFVVHP